MRRTSWTRFMCNPVQILVKTKVVYLKTTEVIVNAWCLNKSAALIQIVNFGDGDVYSILLLYEFSWHEWHSMPFSFLMLTTCASFFRCLSHQMDFFCHSINRTRFLLHCLFLILSLQFQLIPTVDLDVTMHASV